MSKPWFYMSFCDVTKPKGQQFLGAATVQGDDEMDAVKNSWVLGINPGGEIAIVALGKIDQNTMPETGKKYLNKFVPREIVMGEIGDADEPHDAVICQCCNRPE